MKTYLTELLGSNERYESLKKRIEVDTNGCWNWTGALQTRPNQPPCPIIMVKGRREHVSRILFTGWLRQKGMPIEAPKRIFRRCKNPVCINPLHGTVDAPLRRE